MNKTFEKISDQYHSMVEPLTGSMAGAHTLKDLCVKYIDTDEARDIAKKIDRVCKKAISVIDKNAEKQDEEDAIIETLGAIVKSYCEAHTNAFKLFKMAYDKQKAEGENENP